MSDLDELLRDIKPSGYQRIVLPNGDVIPGRDLSPVANLFFPESLEGKTVLDVGCYYGYFLQNAVERGAARAVGLEPDPERFRIASAVAPLWKGKIEIWQQTIEQLQTDETFDYVLFLRVLHHVPDPIEAMTSLAKRCRGSMIVMFREPENYQFVTERFRREGSRPGLTQRLKARLRSRLLQYLGRDTGLVGVGSTALARTYYFNRLAFRHTFVVHRPLFRDVVFRPGHKPGLTLAVCDCGESRS